MKTEKLYYKDAYIAEFSANVISCERAGDFYDAVLDKTAFFPEEGGQYSDRGTLGGANVLNVLEKDGIIHHYVDSLISGEVSGVISFDERYEKMQCHSGEHILSGLIHSLYGLDNVGFHLGAEEVTMDINSPLSEEELNRVEELANEIIYKNVDITTEFPTPDKLHTMQYRAKLDLTEDVRIVRIGEYDSCACCAPHVKSTGEIGIIKILGFTKLRGGIRIYITAGRRAMKTYREYYNSVRAVSALLSIPKSQIAEGVEKLLSDFAEIKSEFASYRLLKIENDARKIERTDGNLVVCLPDATSEELIAFSNIALDRIEGMLVLLSGKDGDYKYVISSKNQDLRLTVKEINKSLLGRGGGRPNMVQGSFACGIEDIRNYFNPLRQG